MMLMLWWQKLVGPARVVLASRRFGAAVRHEKAGRDQEAIETAEGALDLLGFAGVNREGAPALSLILSTVMLLDRVGTKIGQPQIARPAMSTAIETWERAVSACPRLGDISEMVTYVEWFRHRLSMTT